MNDFFKTNIDPRRSPEYWEDKQRRLSTWEDAAFYFRMLLDVANARVAGLKFRVAQLEAQIAGDETLGLMKSPDAAPPLDSDLDKTI